MWCGRRDLNPHDLRHWNLNPARLPVPPRPRDFRQRAYPKDPARAVPPCLQENKGGVYSRVILNRKAHEII